MNGIARHTLRLVVSAAIVVAATHVRAQSNVSTSDKADALSEAARKGEVARVKTLLDEGVDVNTKFRYGATALSYACDRGHLDVVKLLLARGADVAVEDTFYHATPLIWAVSPATDRKPQHLEVVRVLLQHGGFSASQLSDALAAATNDNHEEIVTLLKQAGAKPKEK